MMAQHFFALLLNLDQDTERFAHMEQQLKSAKITFTRHAAILGDDIPADLRPYFFASDGTPKTTMKRGELGCYASHLRALKRVASGEMGPVVLVMEDDLEIDPNLVSLIDEAQRAMPDSWDILRLSCCPRRAYAPIAALKNKSLLVRYSKIPNSAGAYLVTPAGAQKFIDSGVRGLTFDDDLRRPWFHRMDTYGLVPAPIKAGMLKSSIDIVEPGRFDKDMSPRMERLLRGDHFYAFKRLAYNVSTLGLGSWLACESINGIDMVVKPITHQSVIHGMARLFPGGRLHA